MDRLGLGAISTPTPISTSAKASRYKGNHPETNTSIRLRVKRLGAKSLLRNGAEAQRMDIQAEFLSRLRISHPRKAYLSDLCVTTRLSVARGQTLSTLFDRSIAHPQTYLESCLAITTGPDLSSASSRNLLGDLRADGEVPKTSFSRIRCPSVRTPTPWCAPRRFGFGKLGTSPRPRARAGDVTA